MSTPTIFNVIEELKALEDKAAQGKEIKSEDTFVVRAALKAEGWDVSLCEEAISRGYKRSRGEEVAEPSWYTIDDDVPEAPEVQGTEATEEEPGKPGRMFNLLSNFRAIEPEEEDEVREEGLEEPPYGGAALGEKDELLEKLFGYNYWDCPRCTSVNHKSEEICPVCLFLKKDYDRALTEYYKTQKERKMEELKHKPSPIDVLKEKARKHLLDSRKRVTVGDDVGWLCETCNSVWSLEQQMCPNRCKPAEPPTVEHRGWPVGESPLPKIEFVEEEVGDPLAADPNLLMKYDSDVLRKHMAKHLGLETVGLEEKKADMEKRIKEKLGLERLPGEPEPCALCGAYDGDECGCCLTCEETDGSCKCCKECHDYPCICNITEECPICEKRIPLGEPCPSGCDADHIELVKLYEEVKNSTELNFEDKVRYMSLLKEKMKFYGEEEAGFEPEEAEEDFQDEEPYEEV